MNLLIVLVRIVVGLFLIGLAVCLGGMNVQSWEMALWPQGEIMQRLQWTSAFVALLGTALTVFVGVVGLLVLLPPYSYAE